MSMNINRFINFQGKLKFNPNQEKEKQTENNGNKKQDAQSKQQDAEVNETYENGLEMLGVQNRALMNINGVIKKAINRTSPRYKNPLSNVNPAEIAKNQNLTLVEDDEYENDKGRIIAKDEAGNIYDFNPETNEFVLRTYESIKERIMSGDDYFTGVDLVRFVNRNKDKMVEEVDLEEFEARIENGEFDKLMTAEELSPIVDQYVSALVKDLRANGEYSDEYIEDLIKYIDDNITMKKRNNGTTVLNEVKSLFNEYVETHSNKSALEDFEARLEGDEFDREVGSDELWQKIEEYANLVIEDLKNNSSYPEGFIEDLLFFITRYTINDRIRTILENKYGECSDYRHFDGTLNLKEILNELKNICAELIKTPSTECYSGHIGQTLDIPTSDFISYMLSSLYHGNKENLSIPDVFKFENLLIQYIAENYGMIDDLQRNGCINYANIPDENGDGNWIDDLYNIANKFLHINDGLDINGATTINVETLFNDKDELSISELVEKLENAHLSGNAGLNKFGIMINNLLDKFNINSDYDKEDLIKCIMILMNQVAGVKNNYPITITRETVEKLNEKGFFEELDKIMNRDDSLDDGIDCSNLEKLYYFGVDGYIDDFAQGPTGDCWLIATISALSATDSGKQVISDSIKTIKKADENGVEREYIRVTFSGIGVYYDISFEEMVEAGNASAYSFGDNDVLALELATEKLRRDITAGKITLRYGNYGGGNDDDGSFGAGIDGGFQDDMLYYLTGNVPQVEPFTPNSELDVIKFLESIYADFTTGNFAGYFSLGYKDVSAMTTDKRTFYWSKGAGHAFSILSMTEDTITIANPWYPDKPYTFTWEEFAKLMPARIGITSTKVHEPMTLDDYNNKLDGDEFDKEVDKYEIQHYLRDYSELLIDDFVSNIDSNCNEIIKMATKNYLSEYLSEQIDNILSNSQEKYNLKQALLQIKNSFNTRTQECNNTVDYESKFTINKKEYSLNDILDMSDPLMLNICNIDELDNIIKNITSTLYDMEPTIAASIEKTLESYFDSIFKFLKPPALQFVDERDRGHKNEIGFDNYITNSREYIPKSIDTEQYGISKDENGQVQIDICFVVQKMLELVELALQNK